MIVVVVMVVVVVVGVVVIMSLHFSGSMSTSVSSSESEHIGGVGQPGGYTIPNHQTVLDRYYPKDTRVQVKFQ